MVSLSPHSGKTREFRYLKPFSRDYHRPAVINITGDTHGWEMAAIERELGGKS
jgi:hypothetical protein